MKSSRAVRIAAVDLIPELIDVLEHEALVALKRIQQAKKIADSLDE